MAYFFNIKKNFLELCFRNRCALLFFCLTPALNAQKKVQLSSPNSIVHFSLKITEKAPKYSISYKGTTLIDDSNLGFQFEEGGYFTSHLKMGKPQYNSIDETYELVVGKNKKVRNEYREVRIPLVENNAPNRTIILAVRAFNDGIAFRYEFPKQEAWKSYGLLDELTSFKIVGKPTVRTLFWDSYTNTHEGFYNKLPYDSIPKDTLMDMPFLLEFPKKTFMAITEANLRNYAGMYLMKQNENLTCQLSPLPGQSEVKVRAALPHQTPWRVMMISDRIGTLLESNILTNLNEPSKIKDVSWIKPGKTSFHWWNGDIVPDTTFAPGVNFETNKYYIDFCAANNIDYHAVIGYGGFAWYSSNAPGYGAVGSQTDVTIPVPSLDMERVCNYAKEKGVGIHVWVHWQAIYPNLEKAFSKFEEWGINGMMVDFMDRDDQEMVLIQEEILQKAAEHKLYIQFHGSFKPTGLHRTYPNEFTREGARNYEYNKWEPEPITADHDLDIVFTRLLAGSTDYHLGGFRAVPKSDFKTQFTRPLVVVTRCHMLAMYVVLESYLASICDYPDAYLGEPGFDFLKKIPTNWDETKILDAKVDEYVTTARKKGNQWFVGSLNNSKARIINVNLGFLEKGNYWAEIYTDGKEAHLDPNQLDKEKKQVNANDVLEIQLAASGGMVIRLTKVH
ncbi:MULTISPECIES: glycoside hydrolase family 97 protein [unclassified Allomuricauda]|uniref:glycoside hydrolase family 97 protein n=1 Tax=unclassified Allomuricauda TaxID=2615049 RepID=UPI0009DE6AFB|nr:glycoside hydrolase family 97 protein [Muricauda sp. MAR_2010_75]